VPLPTIIDLKNEKFKKTKFGGGGGGGGGGGKTLEA